MIRDDQTDDWIFRRLLAIKTGLGVFVLPAFMAWCANVGMYVCSCNRPPEPMRHEAGTKATSNLADEPHTVLRFLCDIPDDVGPSPRTYRGRIDWSGGSEWFAFTLSKETIDVHLDKDISMRKPVRVFFIVDEAPPFPTKFEPGEWFYRGRPAPTVGEPGLDVYVIPLSRFRDADRFGTKRMP